MSSPTAKILSEKTGLEMKTFSEKKEDAAAYAAIGKIIFWAVALAVIAKLVTCASSMSTTPEFDKEIAIYQACRDGIEGILHSPSTAEFNPPATSLVYDEGGGTYSVYIPLRAENGFGATRKTRGKCIINWSNKPSLIKAEILQ